VEETENSIQVLESEYALLQELQSKINSKLVKMHNQNAKDDQEKPKSLVEPKEPKSLVEPLEPKSLVEPKEPKSLVEPKEPKSLVEPKEPKQPKAVAKIVLAVPPPAVEVKKRTATQVLNAYIKSFSIEKTQPCLRCVAVSRNGDHCSARAAIYR
jgi:hypothetical protein